MIAQVISNRDPYRLGRIFTIFGWLHPLSRKNLFNVPKAGEFVEVTEGFYIC